MFKSFTYFREKEFWRVIGLLDWQFVGDDEKVIERAVQHLSRKSNVSVEGFRNTLNEKLISLEDSQFLNMMLNNNLTGIKQNITSRHFLYTRCSVIAAGYKYYSAVLNNPSKMKENMEFGCLMELPELALKLKHGSEYQNINEGRDLKLELS